nr:MAG TPA: hypothetical protein [Caudoviricetes sp.]
MATVNQIRKQIETAEKTVAKLAERVTMYTERWNKGIAKLNQKHNLELSEKDFTVEVSYGYAHATLNAPEVVNWNDKYSVERAFESADDNTRNHEKETRRLESLRAELEKMEADAARTEKENAPLEAALREAMSDFRVVWFSRMEEYFEKHFDHIREILPAVRARYNKVRKISDKYGWRMYDNHRRIYNRLEDIRKGCAKVISDDAASMERPAYLAKMHDETVKVWDAGIKKLTAKCKTFGVDEEKVVARHPNVTGKGFAVILTDGKDREIDARVIWAAEYSEFICPHTRYIVTERHN